MFILALLAVGVAWGQPSGGSPLTLEAALQIAEHRSRALMAQDFAADAARDMAIAAGRLPDPVLRMSVDNVPVEGSMRYRLSDDFMTMRSVGLTQTLTRGDKRRARSARFEREADAAQTTKVLQLSALRRETARAWFDRYYRQMLLALLVLQRDEARLQVEAVDAVFRGGRGAQADVFMARSAVARIDDAIHDARARLENSRAALARWVGEAADAPPADAPDISQTRLTAQALEHQLDHHPEIALMSAREAVARADAEVAHQDKRADWSVSLMYSQRGSSFSDMVSFGVSIPLQWDQRNRQDREFAAKLAQVEQVRAEREEMTRAHRAEVRNWITSWQSNLQRLDDYDATLIPLASERTRAMLAAYRGGGASLPAVLEARRMEIDTRIERLRIEIEAAALWTQLEYLIPDAAALAGAALTPAAPLPNLQEYPQ